MVIYIGDETALGLEPEVSWEMERQYPKQKRCLTILSVIRGVTTAYNL